MSNTLNVIFRNAVRPQFSPSRSKGSLGDSIPGFIDDLEAVHDMEMIFPELSEGKICSFCHFEASLK